MAGEAAYQVHPIPPVYDEHSEILILGSFPSEKSREAGFFYGHPQNRFWRVLAVVYGQDLPQSTDEKIRFLLRSRLALWDVLAACEIKGSADGTIRSAVPNDVSEILRASPIRRIVVNGKTAEKYYNKYLLPVTGMAAVCLPSTSPANATQSLAALTDAWRAALTA